MPKIQPTKNKLPLEDEMKSRFNGKKSKKDKASKKEEKDYPIHLTVEVIRWATEVDFKIRGHKLGSSVEDQWLKNYFGIDQRSADYRLRLSPHIIRGDFKRFLSVWQEYNEQFADLPVRFIRGEKPKPEWIDGLEIIED